MNGTGSLMRPNETKEKKLLCTIKEKNYFVWFDFLLQTLHNNNLKINCVTISG